MIRGLFVVLGFCLALGACTQRTICPAFQSAFIYDKEALRKKFSYFQEDSTPKVLTASKNQYLVAEPVSYRKKLNSMATIEMKDVNPVVPDSLTMDDSVSWEELERAAMSIIDSTYIVDVDRSRDTVATEGDSVYVITKDKEVRMLRYRTDSVLYKVDDIRYNVDQDNYMWYLRQSIVLPDVRLAQVQEEAKAEAEKKKKGIGGFFRNLFKKKKKDDDLEADSLDTESPVEKSEFDLDYNPDEEITSAQQEEEPEPEKKGFFSFLKKDKKAKNSNGDAADKPARKKKEKKPKEKKEDIIPEEEGIVEEKTNEEQDDGF